MLPIIVPIILKNAPNKNYCIELNFLQKLSERKYMSISTSSGGRGLITYEIVISSEVLFENELIIHNFIVLIILTWFFFSNYCYN